MTCGRSTIGREPAVTEPRGPWGGLLTRDFALPIENHGVRITVDLIALPEWIGAILRDSGNPIEWSNGIIMARDSSVPVEILGGVALDNALPVETLHGVLLNFDALAPMEFQGSLGLDTANPIEIIGTPSLVGDVLRPATPVFVLVPQRPRGS